jgi:hypothetical protein
MILIDVQKIARERGIDVAGLDLVGAVRALQRAEGNFDCFATATGGWCDQLACLWREECFLQASPAATLPAATKGSRSTKKSVPTAASEQPVAAPAAAATTKKGSPSRKRTTTTTAAAITKTKSAPATKPSTTKRATARKKSTPAGEK